MSNGLALAAVTAAIQALIEEFLAAQSAGGIVGANVPVVAVPPDLIQAQVDADGVPRLNFYLYQVATNQGWLNRDHSTHDASGRPANVAPLGLDLHYLLTAYAKDNWKAEVILGWAIQVLHERPVFDRQFLQEKRNQWAGGSNPWRQAFADSGLADQVEQLMIFPETMNTEELSKLWTAFQAKYRPTVAYQVSVALIEGSQVAGWTPRVLKRNVAFGTPVLFAVVPPDNQQGVQLGEGVLLKGASLTGGPGEQMEILATHRLWSTPKLLELDGDPTPTQVFVRVPADPAGFPAGVYSVMLRYTKNTPDGTVTRTTNALTFGLLPEVPVSPDRQLSIHSTQLTPATPDQPATYDVKLTLECSPPLQPDQVASCFLGTHQSKEQTIQAPTSTLTFQYLKQPPEKPEPLPVPAGNYYIRLRVDGQESLLYRNIGTRMELDETQTVTIPENP